MLEANMKFTSSVALILIDVQKGFDEKSFWGKRNNLDAEQNIAKYLLRGGITRNLYFISNMIHAIHLFHCIPVKREMR